MSNKHLDQWINIKFCVKVGKSATETLALLWLIANMLWRNQVFLNGTGSSRKGEEMCKTTQEVGSQKRKGQIQMWTEYKPWCAEIED
jgi:hypothetical protein